MPCEIHIPKLETGNFFPEWGSSSDKRLDLAIFDHSMAGCASVDISTPVLLQAAADCPATVVPTPSSPGDVGDLFCNKWKSSNLRDFHAYLLWCSCTVILFVHV